VKVVYVVKKYILKEDLFMALLDEETTRVNSYELRDIKKGDTIPAVSDTMFSIMFNNTKRKKYVLCRTTIWRKSQKKWTIFI